MNKKIEEQLKIIEEGITKDVTLVADFFHVDTPLYAHAKNIHNYTAPKEHRRRQQLLKDVVRKRVERAFTKDEIASGNIDWETDWKLNIVDHHGILNHPILIATNILANKHQFLTEAPQGVIVLTDSGTPMNNFFHKRGLQFRGQQFNIFPSRQRHMMAYAAPVKTNFPLVDRAPIEMSEEDKQFLHFIEKKLEENTQHPQVTDFLSQVARLNHFLWKQLFEEEIREKIPDVFYISNEEVAVELLREYLKEPLSLWYQVLCDAKMREYIVHVFNGITGCWEEGTNKGTHLFWGLNKNGEAIRMKVSGNTLVSTDDRYRLKIDLTPESIVAALDAKKIYPSMFVVYGISIFTAGVRPLVGYGSMNYQTRMKEKWVEALKNIDPQEAELIKNIPTNGFIGGPKVTFAYEQDQYIDLYALDIIQRGGLTGEYIEHLKKMPFNAVLRPALIDIYDSYVRAENKKPITITSNDLMGDVFSWIKN